MVERKVEWVIKRMVGWGWLSGWWGGVVERMERVG